MTNSTYDPNSDQAKIGDAFSLQTLEEIKQFFPTAKHAEGLTPEYDIVIPEEEYGFIKIECKVCGVHKDETNRRFIKFPLSLFGVTESKYVRIKYYNGSDYNTYYFKTSSLRSYFNKIDKPKILQEGTRKIFLWPVHLLEGMYTKINTTEELAQKIKETKLF